MWFKKHIDADDDEKFCSSLTHCLANIFAKNEYEVSNVTCAKIQNCISSFHSFHSSVYHVLFIFRIAIHYCADFFLLHPILFVMDVKKMLSVFNFPSTSKNQ